MRIRERSLPIPWYPDDPLEIQSILQPYVHIAGTAPACLSPHAGWVYSGSIAAQALSKLDRNVQTIIIVGGHLGPRSAAHVAMEDAFRTPSGLRYADSELRSMLLEGLYAVEDRDTDNSVEILLPMIAFLFPLARLVWLRLPAAEQSFQTGQELARISNALNRSVALVASTDLTHYGPQYGFCPHGVGPDAENWVRDVNDRHLLDSLVSGDAAGTLRSALEDSSACSPGAALCAMGFASAKGLAPPGILRYGTSADVKPSSSFVGYAALSWVAAPSIGQ